MSYTPFIDVADYSSMAEFTNSAVVPLNTTTTVGPLAAFDTVVINGISGLALSAGNSGFTVSEDGLYDVTFNAICENTGGNARAVSLFFFTVGAFNYQAEAIYIRNSDSITMGSLNATITVSLNAGDEFIVRERREGNDALARVINDCKLTVMRLDK